ncbi:MAG: hypothetical protein KC613_19835 [Myxococcales bacterium]|nr:hypothetical protein [Myxococcales bacterium]MCB9523839.1 hypothetical protein [Myxococcales bacterium]
MRHMPLFLTAGLILCACDDDSVAPPTEAPADATAFTLTPAGGTFAGTGPLAGVALTVPAGAVAADTALWMAPPVSERPLPASGRFVGPEVEFGPGEVALAEPATLTLPVDAARVDASGSDLRLVKVWRVGPDGWEIQAPAAEARDGQVQATVEALTRFGAGVEVP